MGREMVLDKVIVSSRCVGPHQWVNTSSLVGNQPGHGYNNGDSCAISLPLGFQLLIEIRKREAGYRSVRGPAAARSFLREKAIGAERRGNEMGLERFRPGISSQAVDAPHRHPRFLAPQSMRVLRPSLRCLRPFLSSGRRTVSER